jgi:hypothetical protein
MGTMANRMLKNAAVLLLAITELWALFCFVTAQGDLNLIILFATIALLASIAELFLVHFASRGVAYILTIQASFQAVLLVTGFFKFLLSSTAPFYEDWRTNDIGVVHAFLLFSLLLSACQFLKLFVMIRGKHLGKSISWRRS